MAHASFPVFITIYSIVHEAQHFNCLLLTPSKSASLLQNRTRGFCLGAHTMHPTLPKQTISTSCLQTKTKKTLDSLRNGSPSTIVGVSTCFQQLFPLFEITSYSLQYTKRLMYCRSQINRNTHNASTVKI